MSASREKRRRREQSASESNPKQKELEKRRQRKAKAGSLALEIGAIAIVVIFVVLLIFNSGILQRSLTAVSIGDYKAKVTELNYYYNNAFRNTVMNMGDYAAQYGLDATKDLHKQPSFLDETQSWADYFYDQAVKTMQQEYVQATLARQSGMELTEDNKTAIDTNIKSLEQYAVTQQMTATQYLRTLFGKGLTIDAYRKLLERNYLSTQYGEQVVDSFTYDIDDLEAYYQEDPSSFDKYTYRSLFISGFDPDSEVDKEVQLQESLDKAEEMVSRLEKIDDPAEREALYIDLCSEYVKDEFKSKYENDPDFTLNRFKSESDLETYLSEFITDPERTYGDVSCFDGTTGYYVVMFVDYGRNEYQYTTYHQIYFSPNTEKTADWTQEEWDKAEETARTLYDMTQLEDFTLDDFIGYAATYSNDTSTKDNGGLYQYVTPGSMDYYVYEWLYESETEHTEGDIELIKGTDGYYLLYFDSYDGVVWEKTAESALKQRDYQAWFEEVSSDYEIKPNKMGLLFADY